MSKDSTGTLERKIEIAKSAARSELRTGMSKGERALIMLECYQTAHVPTEYWPASALREIVSCYRNFKYGKPTAYRVADAVVTPAPMTLGQAFGVSDLKGAKGDGKVALKRRRTAIATPRLVAMYQGGDPPAKDKSGDADAAKRLDGLLTASQVEDFRAAHSDLPGKRKKQMAGKGGVRTFV